MPPNVDLTSAAPSDRLSRTFNAAPPSHSASYNHIIRIIVGPTKQEFNIHKSLVIEKSTYFAQALASNRWKEAQTGTFTLQDDNASIFGCFVSWLYSGKIEHQKTPDAEMFLIESHLFGERRGAPAFCNAVLSCLHTTWSATALPTKEAIVLVFKESLEESALRRLAADKCVWNGATDALQQGDTLDDSSISSEFALAVCKALLARIKSGGKFVVIPKCPSTASGRHVCSGASCAKEFPQHGVKYLDIEEAYPTCSRLSWLHHVCKHCHFAWRPQEPSILVTEKLAHSGAAPYVQNFCKAYHKHDGDKCISC